MKHVPTSERDDGASLVNTELISSAPKTTWSLPSICDGLKSLAQGHVDLPDCQAERRVGAKVAQPQITASRTAYHHGGVSMAGTIVQLAQRHVGSNSFPLLLNDGQFGSRLGRGRSMPPPGTHTKLLKMAEALFRDTELLQQQVVDNERIGPAVLCPVVPLVLLNGPRHGTGYKAISVLRRSPSVIELVGAVC